MTRIGTIIILLFSLGFGQQIPFEVGEKLTYTLKFNVVKMGRGYLSVESMDNINGTDAYHVKFEAKTRKIADRVFPVHDIVDTWLNKSNLTTLRINKDISEGDYHKTYNSTIDYGNQIAITNNDTISINGPVRDPYSLLYYFRTIPLEVGQILDFTTFDQNKSNSFQVIVDGKEKVKVPAGNFPCLIVTPFTEGKTLLKNEGDMTIWFSDDERRLPIQIKIKLKFGSMLLQLKKIG